MTRHARNTAIGVIAAIIVVLLLITFVFPTMVFTAKVVILVIAVLIGFLVLRSAFPKKNARD
jgi:hypothetical protein